MANRGLDVCSTDRCGRGPQRFAGFLSFIHCRNGARHREVMVHNRRWPVRLSRADHRGARVTGGLGNRHSGLAGGTTGLARARQGHPANSKTYIGLNVVLSLVGNLLFMLALNRLGACLLGIDPRKFLPTFSVIFWISVSCWLLGHYGYIAQTPDKRSAMGISWSLALTGEAGFIMALLAWAADRQFLPGLTRLAQGGGRAAGVVYQDWNRDPRRFTWNQGGRSRKDRSR